MSGWMRAALCGAALAAAVSRYPSGAADLPPTMLRQPSPPPPGNPSSSDPVRYPASSPMQDADSGSTPKQARAAIDYVYLCADCHGGIGEGNVAHAVPPLAGQSAPDLKRRLARLSAHHGAADSPDHQRPFSQLTPEQVEAIGDYLATLVPPPAIATQ